MKKIGIVLYLLWGSIQDIKTKTISSSYLNLGMALGIFFLICGLKQKSIGVEEIMVSLIPGSLLLVWGRVSKEKIGYGDGFLFLILGMCLEGIGVWYLCQLAFFLSAVYSVFMMGRKKLSGESKLAFVPFLFISYLVLWRMNYV